MIIIRIWISLTSRIVAELAIYILDKATWVVSIIFIYTNNTSMYVRYHSSYIQVFINLIDDEYVHYNLINECFFGNQIQNHW